MKKYLLFVALAFAFSKVKAQVYSDFNTIGIGVGIGYGKAFADTKKQNYHPAYNIDLVYNYHPYLPIALEFQFGTLSGGGRTVDKDQFGRIYKNNYKALILHADLQAGEIIDYSDNGFLNAIKGLYVGTGIGFIINNIVDIQRTNLIPENGPTDYIFPGKGAGKNTGLLLPLRFGYEFKFFDDYDRPAYAIIIGYQHNIAFGEGLDGYDDNPGIFKNRSKDQYAQISIGFKYSFTGTKGYYKNIQKY